jgi:hypothetical protein
VNKSERHIEIHWIAEQRERVVDYLRSQEIDHLGVGEYPAFHVHPYIALWAVQSRNAPDRIGWWAISGDLPTDYISSAGSPHPRDALREFSRYWRELAEHMLRGEPHPKVAIGKPEQWSTLGDLLRRRADLLHDWASNDGAWNREE